MKACWSPHEQQHPGESITIYCCLICYDDSRSIRHETTEGAAPDGDWHGDLPGQARASRRQHAGRAMWEMGGSGATGGVPAAQGLGVWAAEEK